MPDTRTIPARRVLSLDGGGVKGMAILLILKRLFRTIQHNEGLPYTPRPCTYFDLIGGTSTGGLIAILLGRLCMSIDECIKVFRHVSEEVFKENPSRFYRAIGSVIGKPYFDSSKLEQEIKKVLSSRGLEVDTRFCEKGREDSDCKVFVCATRAPTVVPVLLRSYLTWQVTEENYDCFIWEAAKATSAAPLFFEPTQLQDSRATFVDGALHFNNPISEVINEAIAIWPGAELKSIVSIGTGWTDPKPLETSQLKIHHVVKTCIDLAMNSHKEAQRFVRDDRGKALSEAGVYFRFDVDRRIDTVELHQWQKLDDVDAYTDAYLTRSGSEVEKCARSLCRGQVAQGDNSRVGGLLSTLPRYSDTSDFNPMFSGREAELSEIGTLLERSPQSRQTVCLHGLGGIGKSQIAFEYARRCSATRSVFWIRANNSDNIAAGYLAIAKRFLPKFNTDDKIPLFETVKDLLANGNARPWLLVFDDADDLDLFVEDRRETESPTNRLVNYIPFVSHGHILFTTRQSRLVGKEDMVPAQNGISVREMTVEDGLTLFRKCMPRELLSKTNETQRRDFLDMLGGLPLAIVQATAYMREEQLPVDGFIRLYQEIETHDVLFREKVSSVDKPRMSVLVTWEISYRKIAYCSDVNSKSHPAIILDLLGLVDSQSLPSLRKLSEGQVVFQDSTGPNPIDGLEGLFEEQHDPSRVLEAIYNSNLKKKASHNLQLAIGPLCNFSLVTSRACWVHPVVHTWVYRRLPLDEQYKYLGWLAEELLNKISMADKGVQENWEDFVLGVTVRQLVLDELTPFRHARAVIRHAISKRMVAFTKERGLSMGKFARLLFQVGRMTASAGNIDKAKGYIGDAIEIMRGDVLYSDPTILAEWQLHLAKVRSAKLSAREATIEAETYAISSGAPTAQAALWLAECLWREQRWQEALAMFRNITAPFSIYEIPTFRRDKEVFVATVGQVYVLTEIGDENSKAEARRIIDHSLVPFFHILSQDHVLKILQWPKILLCRIQVANGLDDQARSVKELIDHGYRNIGAQSCVTGGNPELWRAQIHDLQLGKKWLIIEVVAQEYTRQHFPLESLIKDNYSHSRTTSNKLEAFRVEVDHWCNIYTQLGRAYYKQQKFREAAETHWKALGMWFSLCPSTIHSAGFQSNLWYLDKALELQGIPRGVRPRALLHNYIARSLWGTARY